MTHNRILQKLRSNTQMHLAPSLLLDLDCSESGAVVLFAYGQQVCNLRDNSTAALRPKSDRSTTGQTNALCSEPKFL